MSHEILSFQIGQCGNSIGLQFWQSLTSEHGLGPDGQLIGEDLLQSIDNKNTFFHQCESGKFVPRCIMLDLEPRVIQSIKNSEYSKIFDQRNMFVGKDGGGAGNNWARGYMQAHFYSETLLDMIYRETEAMDLMEGSLVSHAISGGTGAGMGSYILELLTDHFPKKVLQTYSVFPNTVNLQETLNYAEGQYGDVVIEPYNSLLTLQRLTTFADSVVVLDNRTLHNKTQADVCKPVPSFANINKIVADVMAASVAPVRFPSLMFNCLGDIILSLTPVPKLHFLMAGYIPLSSSHSKVPVKSSVECVMKQLHKMRNMLVSLHHPLNPYHGHISVFNVIQGNDVTQKAYLIRQTISQFCQKVHYLPWAEPIHRTVFCPRSPYLTNPNRTSGLTLVNHSTCVNFFKSALSQFGKLYSRLAYINQMQNLSGFDDLDQELHSCKKSCEELVSEYESALNKNYPN